MSALLTRSGGAAPSRIAVQIGVSRAEASKRLTLPVSSRTAHDVAVAADILFALLLSAAIVAVLFGGRSARRARR